MHFVSRFLAPICALSLIIASAGFGAVFAWTVAKEHSYLLAVLTVLFAISLEGLKPLAVSASFSAFNNWQLGRGFALLLLGLVAVAYSLTSELALMAGSRGDLAATREQHASASVRAKDRYLRASQELASLPRSRTVGELEALIAKQSRQGCSRSKPGTSGSWVCPVQTSLLSELARAKRKVELEAAIQEADKGMAGGSAVTVSDPGATALVVYLAAAGMVVQVGTLSQWLTLVPVIALELGSALSVLVVQAMGTKDGPPRTTLEAHVVPLRTANQLCLPKPGHTLSAAILDHLRGHAGVLRTTERALAGAVGSDKTTVRRAILGLAEAGILEATPSKMGTVLRLLE